MAKLRLRGKDLKKIGFHNNQDISLALDIVKKEFKNNSKQEVLGLLESVLESPEDYVQDKVFSLLANRLVELPKIVQKEISLNDEPKPHSVFGNKHISSNAKLQMKTALQLPISVTGALMPDAHHGYGLPIGGVLATKNAVIPYGVGVDIGCRMSLSIYDLRTSFLDSNSYKLKSELKEKTRFGKNIFSKPIDHPILERTEFRDIAFVKNLKDKAYRQIGTSGSGNHFVEFGIANITDIHNEWDLPLGDYVAVLSHSGSRGMGAAIANHYTNIAMQECFLPSFAKNLAWLSLDSEAGIEYWQAMSLAGDYASACHHQIHNRLSKVLGEKPVAIVENHHNFAWKEQINGEELIVHRKGATPAAKGVLGIIPGSMADKGYIVRGKGNTNALNSASHGAGRAMSRTQARNSFTMKSLRQHLSKKRISLIGGGIDESPMAYKNIEDIIACQGDLVDIIGSFQPRIVRMDK